MSAEFLTESMHAFFHDQIEKTIQRQRVESSPRSISYLVNVLVTFSETQQVTRGAEGRAIHKPLAEKLQEALETSRPEERFLQLRELGDLALYISGFFPGYVAGRVVDLAYYISMGSTAYNNVSAMAKQRSFDREVISMFEELSKKFRAFTEVFNEIAESARQLAANTPEQLVRLYERWLQTRSPESAKRLQSAGGLLLWDTANVTLQ